jgi:hypothetical protein
MGIVKIARSKHKADHGVLYTPNTGGIDPQNDNSSEIEYDKWGADLSTYLKSVNMVAFFNKFLAATKPPLPVKFLEKETACILESYKDVFNLHKKTSPGLEELKTAIKNFTDSDKYRGVGIGLFPVSRAEVEEIIQGGKIKYAEQSFAKCLDVSADGLNRHVYLQIMKYVAEHSCTSRGVGIHYSPEEMFILTPALHLAAGEWRSFRAELNALDEILPHVYSLTEELLQDGDEADPEYSHGWLSHNTEKELDRLLSGLSVQFPFLANMPNTV